MKTSMIDINEVVWEPSIYPRQKWNTGTIERYADAQIKGSAFECLWAITKYGTMKQASQQLNAAAVWVHEQLPNQEFVYFIQSLDKIKIGLSHGKRFPGRVEALHVANPHGLNLICAILGNRDVEMQLHAILSKWRVSGEWFEMLPVILYLNNQQYDFGDMSHE